MPGKRARDDEEAFDSIGKANNKHKIQGLTYDETHALLRQHEVHAAKENKILPDFTPTAKLIPGDVDDKTAILTHDSNDKYQVPYTDFDSPGKVYIFMNGRKCNYFERVHGCKNKFKIGKDEDGNDETIELKDIWAVNEVAFTEGSLPH